MVVTRLDLGSEGRNGQGSFFQNNSTKGALCILDTVFINIAGPMPIFGISPNTWKVVCDGVICSTKAEHESSKIDITAQ